MRLSIRSLLLIAGVTISLGFAIAIGASSLALSNLRIGGPLYKNLKLDLDLLADILPPPEYVIEPYLEATIAKQDLTNLAAHRAKLTELQKTFNERVNYWRDQNLTADIRAKLARSNGSAAQFWSIINSDYLPALAGGDNARMEKAYAALAAAYASHRRAVDELVAAENQLARAAMVEQTTAAARNLASETVELSRLMSYFTIEKRAPSSRKMPSRAA